MNTIPPQGPQRSAPQMPPLPALDGLRTLRFKDSLIRSAPGCWPEYRTQLEELLVGVVADEGVPDNALLTVKEGRQAIRDDMVVFACCNQESSDGSVDFYMCAPAATLEGSVFGKVTVAWADDDSCTIVASPPYGWTSFRNLLV